MSGVRHYERGTSLPETAIIIAVALALVFGTIDFGRALYTYGFVANVARQGARWAIVRGYNSCLSPASPPHVDHCNAASNDVQTYVRGLSVGLTDPTKITAKATWPGCAVVPGALGQTNAPGCPVVVQVKYPFSFILPYMPGPTIPMSSTSQMVISQ